MNGTQQAENAAKAAAFRVKQGLPYEAKVKHAEIRAKEFFAELDGACHVAVGGLDSITLLIFLRKIGIDVPAISVSCLEDKSIQRIHRELGVVSLRPEESKVEIIREFGYPVISKETAKKIMYLQHPTEKNAGVRRAVLTGMTTSGTMSTRMALSKKWLKKFGGSDPEGAKMGYKAAPFLVSEKCCEYLKERPCRKYAKEHGTYPFLGLMASEHGRREKALVENGCNYYGKTTKRSAPFAIFGKQDLLQLALDLRVPVPEVYGEIVRENDGALRTTKAQRTGCSMCGFGIHLEKRPHRFDRLRAENEKEWHFWMYTMGWGEVLSYIGVEWE